MLCKKIKNESFLFLLTKKYKQLFVHHLRIATNSFTKVNRLKWCPILKSFKRETDKRINYDPRTYAIVGHFDLFKQAHKNQFESIGTGSTRLCPAYWNRNYCLSLNKNQSVTQKYIFAVCVGGSTYTEHVWCSSRLCNSIQFSPLFWENNYLDTIYDLMQHNSCQRDAHWHTDTIAAWQKVNRIETGEKQQLLFFYFFVDCEDSRRSSFFVGVSSPVFCFACSKGYVWT